MLLKNCIYVRKINLFFFEIKCSFDDIMQARPSAVSMKSRLTGNQRTGQGSNLWRPHDTVPEATLQPTEQRARLVHELAKNLSERQGFTNISLFKHRKIYIIRTFNCSLHNLQHTKKDLAITLTVQNRRPETNQRGPAFHCFTAGLPKTEFGLPLPN